MSEVKSLYLESDFGPLGERVALGTTRRAKANRAGTADMARAAEPPLASKPAIANAPARSGRRQDAGQPAQLKSKGNASSPVLS